MSQVMRRTVVAFGLLYLMYPSWTAAEEAQPLQVEHTQHAPRIGELEGRHRLELRVGFQSQGGSTVRSDLGGVSHDVGLDNFSAGGGYSYWFRPDWALSVAASSLDSTVETSTSRSEVRSVVAILVGLRHDLVRADQSSRLRPYVTASVGPYVRSGVTSGSPGGSHVGTSTAFGGQLGGGVDVQLSRLLMVGGHAGYNFMSDFSSPAGKDNYSGFEAGISVSFLFGKGSGPQE